MSFDINHARKNLQSSNIRKLFIEDMGWDRADGELDLPFGSDQLHLTSVAQKRGMLVYICSPLADGSIPLYADRRKIENQVRKTVHEHIIIFTNLENSRQVWQWVRRDPGRPTTCRDYEYSQGQSGQALLVRLQGLVFTLEEEERLGIVDVTSRVRAGFDVERVTKPFYDRFKDEHTAFLKFLKGIPDEDMQRWYVSVTMNRLMFVYFIQKQGFLNDDRDYLKNKLIESKQKGANQFYKKFLCPLFFEGFAINKIDRKSEMIAVFGDVPYLNGGIFQQHQIELAYGKQIEIPDDAFKRVFEFFDKYRWNLDERPLRNDKEINPDVLGYIFEKYINQKEMGAYYTKEDITGYICRSTILPYLLDQAHKDCAIAFTGQESVWKLLTSEPKRYIYESQQKGCYLHLPDKVQVGIDDVTQRGEWNKPGIEEFVLPTETWREVVARRTRYDNLFQKLSGGEVHEVNDLITYNLDIEQFTQDVIQNSEGPELLRAFWKALCNIKVLDPTCGSGAFLFAALNMLEPLYEACLDRMRIFMGELNQSGEKHRPEKFSDFRELLEQVEQHDNEHYFILKSIIVNNLFGVDIMEEAVEICKLRLFLKLISQVEEKKEIEPLPDIDFNIRAGNTLVGFTKIDEVRQAMMNEGQQFRMLYPDEESQLKRIEEEADLANKAYRQFQNHQLGDGIITVQDKVNLRGRLDHLNDELNRSLARTYNIHPDSLEYSSWLEKYKPLHWLVDFFGIMNQGGFDVIIGNPPYVEYNKIRKIFLIRDYKTNECGNLYAFICERSMQIKKTEGWVSFITPISLISTQRMKAAQDILFNKNQFWISNFSERPSKLFSGAEVLLTVFIVGKQTDRNIHNYSTGFIKWASIQRPFLFSTIYYEEIIIKPKSYIIPKISDSLENQIITKILDSKRKLGSFYSGKNDPPIYYRIGGGRYWKIFTNFKPVFILNGEVSTSSRENYLYFKNEHYRNAAICLLSSSLFYWFFVLTTNCRDLNPSDLSDFPFDLSGLSTSELIEFDSLCKKLMNDYKEKSVQKNKTSSITGEIKYQEFYPRYSKSIIDEIDTVLAKHYGFSVCELDFIINYDIKYRMGSEIEEQE
jgi:type I restriction-modification system DNA methylase subunit